MKAVFLDRDGVINVYPGDFNYVTCWENFEFLPEIESALKKLISAGFRLFIISNQAGVAKGIYSQETLNTITDNMSNALREDGINIDKVYYCTHHPQDNCSCRKPKTGLVDTAINELKAKGENLDLNKSYFIGDSMRDIETGKKSGLKTILVFSGREKPENRQNWHIVPDFTAKDLPEAARIILEKE